LFLAVEFYGGCHTHFFTSSAILHQAGGVVNIKPRTFASHH
jgi:hypothetical protein